MVRAGRAADLGVIFGAPRDRNTVVSDSAGGSVTDLQGLITVPFPQGVLGSPTPITVTPIPNRSQRPAKLRAIAQGPVESRQTETSPASSAQEFYTYDGANVVPGEHRCSGPRPW